MARYNKNQVTEMLKRAGFSRTATAQDVAAANRFGEKAFARTKTGIDNTTPPPEEDAGTGTPPTDLLGIYKQAFGDEAGQALYDSLQTPTPRSNEELKTEFETQFNPYYQELQAEYGTDFATQTQRAQQDFAYNQANFEQQAMQANRNAIGGYNDQFGDAFGSQMQLTKEAERQEALKRQREQMQQGFERRNYDLNQLNTRRLKDLENSRQVALGDYANTYRYSEVV